MVAALLFGMVAPPALASRFSDVGDECAYQPQIEALAAATSSRASKTGASDPVKT